jgi:hypothetical protein
MHKKHASGMVLHRACKVASIALLHVHGNQVSWFTSVPFIVPKLAVFVRHWLIKRLPA